MLTAIAIPTWSVMGMGPRGGIGGVIPNSLQFWISRRIAAACALMVDTAKKCQATELDVELFCKGIEKICLDDEDNVSVVVSRCCNL